VTDPGPSSYYNHSHPNHHQPHDHHGQNNQGGFIDDAYSGSYENAFTQDNWYSATDSYFGPVGNSDGITLFDSHEIDIGQLGLSNDVPSGAWVEFLPATVLDILGNSLSGYATEH
jgi:hypothetical protein